MAHTHKLIGMQSRPLLQELLSEQRVVPGSQQLSAIC